MQADVAATVMLMHPHSYQSLSTNRGLRCQYMLHQRRLKCALSTNLMLLEKLFILLCTILELSCKLS